LLGPAAAQLAKDFARLSLNKLAYTSIRNVRAPDVASQQCTFAPAINSRSRVLDDHLLRPATGARAWPLLRVRCLTGACGVQHRRGTSSCLRWRGRRRSAERWSGWPGRRTSSRCARARVRARGSGLSPLSLQPCTFHPQLLAKTLAGPRSLGGTPGTPLSESGTESGGDRFALLYAQKPHRGPVEGACAGRAGAAQGV
jgi:hypothetical protein